MSRKKDQSPVPRAHVLPAGLAHQHLVLLQGDQGIEDVHVDLAEVESVGLVFPLPILATDLEERQVHGGVAYFHQDVSAGAPDRMVTAIEACVVGPVAEVALSHPWRADRWLRSGPASSENRPSPLPQGKDGRRGSLRREGDKEESQDTRRWGRCHSARERLLLCRLSPRLPRGTVSEPQGALLDRGGVGERWPWWLKVLLHTQWRPTCRPAPYQPIPGPAHLARLAGGLEAGDVVVSGAGAEPGAGVVRVPALPDLWGAGISGADRNLEARGGRSHPHPRARMRLAALGCLPPSLAFLRLLASGFAPQPPALAHPAPFQALSPLAPKLGELGRAGHPLWSGLSPGGRSPSGWYSHTG